MQPNRIQGAGQPTLGAQRVSRALHNPNEPFACPQCGSIVLLEVTAQIFTTAQSGFRSVSQVPLKAYLCLCGALIKQPGLTTSIQAGGERDWFAQSIDAALARRAETSPDALARGFAGIQELEALKQRVDHLTAQLEALGIEPIEGSEPDEVIAPNLPEPVEAPAPAPVIVAQPHRTEAAAAEGDVKFVTPTPRATSGNARERMKRQGK